MIEKTYSFFKDGKANEVYTLTNKNGVEVDVLTYGARIIRISAPDKKGKFADVVVGCKTPEDYYEPNPCFGGTVGRFANRIGGAKFVLNGETFLLEKNDHGNCLHGGNTATFSTQVWDAKIVNDCLSLTHFSPDGAGGFPGNLTLTLSITLSDDNELRLEYQATTDKDTVCNFTNHTYFNLGGKPNVLEHELFLLANEITKVDDELIPHGELIDVTGTPYDFRKPKTIGRDIFANDPALQNANGYDFNYCIDRIGKGLEHFGYVYDKESGRRMDCYTTLPAVQLYTACKTGNYTGSYKGDAPYENYCAFCLETQDYPNAPNVPQFPNTTLKAGETYHEITLYRFSAK